MAQPQIVPPGPAWRSHSQEPRSGGGVIVSAFHIHLERSRHTRCPSHEIGGVRFENTTSHYSRCAKRPSQRYILRYSPLDVLVTRIQPFSQKIPKYISGSPSLSPTKVIFGPSPSIGAQHLPAYVPTLRRASTANRSPQGAVSTTALSLFWTAACFLVKIAVRDLEDSNLSCRWSRYHVF